MQTPLRFIIFLFVFILFLGGLSWSIIYMFTNFLPITETALSCAYIFFIAFPIILIINMLIGNKFYNKINGFIYTVAVLWIPLLLYVFMALLIITMISFFVPTSSLPIITIIIFAGLICLLIWGIYIALTPRVITHKIKALKLKEKWGDKKIILFSDVHLGMVRHKKFMQKIATMINNQKPDIVFIAGDLIDGPVFPYEDGLSPLSSIKSTYGIFYTAGNHDEYNSEQEKYYSSLNKYATVLNDKKVVVNETEIAGLIYAQESIANTQLRLQKIGLDKNMPSIVMLHDPKNVSALSDEEVTLSLSGHTHAGQFFPLTLIVRSMYKSLTKGVHYIKDMSHITSVGVGTAGPLLRLGTQPEIVIIEIL